MGLSDLPTIRREPVEAHAIPGWRILVTDKEAARRIFADVLRENPRNVEALLGMAAFHGLGVKTLATSSWDHYIVEARKEALNQSSSIELLRAVAFWWGLFSRAQERSDADALGILKANFGPAGPFLGPAEMIVGQLERVRGPSGKATARGTRPIHGSGKRRPALTEYIRLSKAMAANEPLEETDRLWASVEKKELEVLWPASRTDLLPVPASDEGPIPATVTQETIISNLQPATASHHGSTPATATHETIVFEFSQDAAAPQANIVPRSSIQYQVLEELGRGAFAVVSRVRLAENNDTLVLRSFRGEPEAPAGYQDRMRKRFRRGLGHHNSVSGLNGIVRLRTILEDDHEPAAILDHVDGVSLRGMQGSVREKIEVLRKLASTVAVLHEHGLVHRDLKPDNVLVTASQCPILLDFDLAATREGTQKTTLDPNETPILPASNYHHPEFRDSFDRGAHDPKFNGHNIRQPTVDVHGLGGLLLLALTERDPEAEYAQTTRAVFRATHRGLIAAVGAGAANYLLGTALRCLVPRLKDTPSLGELLEALDAFATWSGPCTTRQAISQWLFGAPLHSVADLQREYAHPVIQTMRFRRALKLGICLLALLGPALLWYLVGKAPLVRLSLAFLADLCYVATASHLLNAANDVGADASNGKRSIVSTELRVSHHVNHVAWLVSFGVLLASILAIPWQFAWHDTVTPSPARPETPIALQATQPKTPLAQTDGLEMTYIEPHPVTSGTEVLALWNASKGHGYTTTFIGPDGAVAGTCDTIVVGTPHGTWEVVVQKEKKVVPDIVYIDDPPIDKSAPPRMTEVETAVLYTRGFLTPGVVKQVVPPAVGEVGELTVLHEYEALGGYGPFVFAREHLGEYGGGAAGWSTARFHVFDLSAPDSSIALYSGNIESTITRRESFLTAGEFTAVSDLRTGLKDPTDFGDGPYSPGIKGELTGYYPTFPGGSTRWIAQFTWPSDRGHGDDYWDTYSKSGFTVAAELSPQRLRDTAPLRWAEPGTATPTFRGWSWVPKDELGEIARRPDCRY